MHSKNQLDRDLLSTLRSLATLTRTGEANTALLRTKQVVDHAGHSQLQPQPSLELRLEELPTTISLNNNALTVTRNLKDAMEDG